jgi:hypothetical protein
MNINQGAGKLGKNDITWGSGKSTCVPPDQKLNKAEELTYLSLQTLDWASLARRRVGSKLSDT